jgi:hypothetical protein
LPSIKTNDYDRPIIDTSLPSSEEKSVVSENGVNRRESLKANGDLVAPMEQSSQSNGTLANGKSAVHQVAEQPKHSLGRQIAIGLLDLLIVILLVATVVVFVFETVGPHDQPAWFHPHVNNFRNDYYEGWRGFVLNRYRRMFH